MSGKVINGPLVLIICSILTKIIIVASVNEDGKTNLVEGDIAGFAPHFLQFEAGGSAKALRAFRWTKNTVPYLFQQNYPPQMKRLFTQAIRDIQGKTCIRFVPRTNQRNYIRIIQANGCYSIIGMAGGRQDVSLPPGCAKNCIFIHELLHAIGFPHEQSRQDRDQFVTVHWNNIIPNMAHNFDRFVVRTGGPYDYNSLMHYDRRDFSKNGRDTLTPNRRNVRIGQRIGMSPGDVKEVNKLYCGKGKRK